ncbi:MAG: ATP cone domain-containing protein, partial [Minisyncoccota bacterium]
MPKTAKVSTPSKTVAVTAPVSVAKISKETARYRVMIPQIEKRDGRLVPFDFDKIVSAIWKAMMAAGEGSQEDAVLVAHQVAGELGRFAKKYKSFLPTVEGQQDSVEKYLIINDYVKTAKAYILYRDKRAQLRAAHVEVPEHVRKLAEESKKYFEGNTLGEFVYLRTYAKWIPEEGRRETWVETVDRYMSFMRENLDKKLTEKEYAEIRTGILKQEVMPSMRLMQFAGEPARRCNTCAYNCTFTAPTKLTDFAEIMYLSMQGCGVGFAVESQNVEQFPQIMKQAGQKLPTHVIADSKEGWCDALTLGVTTWYAGKDIAFDFSKIRPAGARLKTMGGKASGPEPLRSLLAFARERIFARQGRRLRSIDVHDIICKIGECVVAGGVRRTAMISCTS